MDEEGEHDEKFMVFSARLDVLCTVLHIMFHF